MGRSVRVLSLSLALLLTAATASAATGEMTLEINDSQRVGLYGAASSVIVGDPAVADVYMVDSHSVILTGHGFGATHVTVLDGAGHALFDRRIVVVAGEGGHVTVHRGPAISDYSCSPRCEMAAGHGDQAKPAASPAAPAPAPANPTP
jgi:hypothetical protein